MSVKLVSYTQPPPGDNQTSLLDLVAFCARVSNPENQNNTKTSEKLVRYLIKNEHWSPLEMVSVCLEIETTRDIARQILRHRSFSFQEFSQRYAVIHEEPVKFREVRLQDHKNRQNSIETADAELQDSWNRLQQSVHEASRDAYSWALTNGVAKEVARSVLPEGLTTTRLYMNGTLRSWVHYVNLRGSNGTQKEHVEIAKACAQVIDQIFPISSIIYGSDTSTGAKC